MSRARVLLVDDHTIFREGIRALLTGYDELEIVGDAANGRDAVEKVCQIEPDVVLMDIAMPLMDGLEATRRISKETPSTKVIILTQYVEKEYILAVFKSGASGCLPKNVAVSELVSAIHAVNNGETYLHSSVASLLVGDYLKRIKEDPFDSLTRREREVLKLVAESRTNNEIAELLAISVKTVLGHRANIMEKLDIHNRTDLIKYAIRKGLISVHF